MAREIWQPTTPSVDESGMSGLLRANPVVVVHFWVGWNAQDRAMDETLRHVRPDFTGRVAFRAMDTEAPGNWTFALGAGVTNWPAVACWVRGRRIGTLIGLRSRGELREWIEKQVASLS